ncbi:MAG: hypothetical protein QOE70_1381 [Chthoniobacter sp.]|nr:hypothetical protein [Chthoniobacter sp.]
MSYRSWRHVTQQVISAVGLGEGDQAQSALAAGGAARRLVGGGRLFDSHRVAPACKDGARGGEIRLAPAVAQDPVMADAHQPGRQDVEAEAADRFPHRKEQ